MDKLVIRQRGIILQTIDINKYRLTIGRSKSNDIVINDCFLSRFHAAIYDDNGKIIYKDLGSSNGSYINGIKIDQEVILKDRDVIEIGETQIEYIKEKIQSYPKVKIIFSEGNDKISTETIAIPMNDIDISRTIVESNAFYSKASQLIDNKGYYEVAEIKSKEDIIKLISLIGIALLPQTSMEETLNMTLNIILEYLPAERAFIFFVEGDEFICKKSIYKNKRKDLEKFNINISHSILKKVAEERSSILTLNASQDSRFQMQESVIVGNIRSVIAAPLVSNERVIGILYADNPIENKFSEENLRVLSTIASVASVKIDQHYAEEERIVKKKIEEELKLASEIQARLLAEVPPMIKGWEIAAAYYPCRGVGGDYYDFIYDNSRNILTFAIGDVSGKGIAAALIMSSIHAFLKAKIKSASSLKEIFDGINNYLYENTLENKYATLFIGQIDICKNLLRYINAGHIPPIIINSNGAIQRLTKGNIPVGLFNAIDYKEESIYINKYDIILAFTDGLTDTINEYDENFSEDRLINCLNDNLNLHCSEILDKIIKELSSFQANSPMLDDVTIIIIKKL